MSFCIACRRSVRNAFGFFSSRVVPILVIAALLSPAFFILFSGTVEASGKRPRKTVTAPPSAPPEPFIIGAQPTTPIFTILAVEAFSTITSSFIAMFSDASVATLSTTEHTEDTASLNIETETQPAPPQPAAIVDFDFDNDGKTDIGRWKTGTSEFEIDPSNGGANLVYDIGSSTSKFVPGDFNGDGATDAVVFDSGTWTYKTSPGASSQTFSFGQSGDIPMPADYNGGGTTDAAVFRPSTGVWWIQPNGGSAYSVSFGTTGDIPVTGDFDGDGKADQAVFRPSTGVWHINGSLVGYYGSGFGVASDVPVPADYDGDGKTDVAVYRGSAGTWYIQTSGPGADITQVWGNYGDQPVPGDFDGDDEADLAVWRPTTGVWYIKKSSGGHEYHTLGIPGDRAVPSAFIKQIGGEVAPYDLAKARLSPKNATGGTNLYSQNFSWGTSLVGLPGRAGLNAGFGMSYNSLVWTKEGSNVHFDTNYDNISPGFRFGFPTIEAPYYLNPAGEGDPFFSYIMVSPSGARTEFRQIGVTDTFETADSSYLQLKTKVSPDPNQPVEEIALEVRGTDGTLMTYVWIAGAFRCTEIKDRNGNYVTIDHSEYGQLEKVTDTLGREIVVNYDNELYPTTIQQTWKGTNGSGSNTTHTWATFTYTTKTVATDFDGVTNVGPANDTIIKVLDKVTYPDTSYTKFHYNGYIQVWKVENFAANNDLLNHVRTNLESPAADQTDSPKFTATWNKAANFNSGNEIKINNSLTASQSFTLPGSLPNTTGTKIEVWMDGHPYDAVTKTIVGASGWQEGLTLATEEHADNIEGGSNARQRWTWNEWTQDDTGSADILNPRITETRVGDASNVKKTEIDYLLYPTTTVAKYGLVDEVRVYDTDLTTVLKKQETEYNLDSAYVNRRIIGLPAKVESYGYESSSLNLVSKITYAYDEGNFSDSGLSQNISPVQHDNTNYGSAFITGRANLTSTTRWNVEYPTTSGEAVSSSQKYNTAGAVVSKTDPASRTVKIGYADNWNSGGNPTTYAYPTSLTDPADVSSTVMYRYDIGANVEADSPAPTGQTYGKTSKRLYDSIGRLEKDSIYIHTTEHAYTRYSRPDPDNGVEVFTHTTLVDTDSDGADVDDEVISLTQYDGAGRVRRSRTEHPGSSGGWSGSITEYDILGRTKRQSVPTEVDGSWTAAGDDATRGFLWTYQKYDWMGRVVRKINTDGADSPTLNDSDVLISYAGCGCAGGLETTIEGELVPRDDVSANARRKQKIYADILGRQWKTVLFQWDGSTPYTTTEHFFNGRDQVLETKQTDNTSLSSPQTSQSVTMTYDGHGRMQTRHYPIEDTATETTWTYNDDDSVAQIVDPRGVITNLTYNSRGLTTGVAYTPTGGIPDSPTVTYGYDNLGNRVSTDTAGVSETTYAYDPLSRLTSETIDFDDLSNNYTIGYEYEIGGGLKVVEEPLGEEFYYSSDKTGRLTEVAGTTFGNNTTGQYLDSIEYRAFGQIKEMSVSSVVTSMEYDDRLRVASHQVHNGSGYLLKAAYTYNADSQVSNTDNQLNNLLDQWYKYDFAGRLSYNEFGSTLNANSETIWTYTQALSYGGFSEMTHRATTTWNVPSDYGRTMTNGRLDAYGSETLDYDAAGNLLRQEPNAENWQASVFDAAGRKTGYEEEWRRGGPISGQPLVDYHGESTITRDGEGRIVKEDWDKTYVQNSTPSAWETTSRSIYSTVLGGEIASIEENFYGVMEKTRVYAGGAVIGEQQRWTATGQSTGETYSHIFRDPVSGSVIRGGLEEHYEPLGQKINPIPPLEEPTFPGPNDGFNDARFPEWQCQAAAARQLSGSELPAHCQRVAEQKNIAAKIDVEWPAWPEKDGNALKLTDSPLFNGSGGNHASLSFATRTMSASLTTTAKRLKGDGDDAEEDNDQIIKISTWANAIDMSDSGWTEASVSGEKQQLTGDTFALGFLDMCKFLLPKDIPADVSVDNNIATTQNKVVELRRAANAEAGELQRSGDIGARSAAAGAALAADVPGGRIDKWFESMVAETMPWDYKYLTEDRRYEPFGNFNYGATGAAAGYSLGQLQRMAGWVQKVEREGESPYTKVQARMGIGGKYPYGDQRKDAEQISSGVSYFFCRKNYPLK